MSSGLAVILVFIGVKLGLHWSHLRWPSVPEVPEVPTLTSLASSQESWR